MRFVRIAKRIMLHFRAGNQASVSKLANARITMRSGRSAKPMDSIFTPAASARARA